MSSSKERACVFRWGRRIWPDVRSRWRWPVPPSARKALPPASRPRIRRRPKPPAPFPDAADLAERAPVGAGSADAAVAPASAEILAPGPATERLRRRRGPAAPAQPLAVGDVRGRRPGGEGRHDRPCLSVAGDLDHLVRQEPGASSPPARACGADWRSCSPPARWRGGARAADPRGPLASMLRAARHEAAAAPAGLTRGDGGGFLARVGSQLSRIEVQAARRLEPRDGRPRDDRRHRALRRPVRHRLGDHEQLHRHLRGADHQPRGGGAGDRRGAAGDRLRARRRNPGRGHLQPLRPLDRRLRAGSPTPPPASERLASRDLDHRRLVPGSPRGGVAHGWSLTPAADDSSRRRTRSTSRRSST